jgi:hypothetical protein
MVKQKNSNIPHNDLVVKSNSFALGVLDDKYTVLMRDMMVTAISRVDTNAKRLPRVLLPVDEFIDINDGKGLRRLERSRLQLLKSTCEYAQPNGAWRGITVFSEIEWEPGTATLSFEFNEKMRPELIDLQTKFTQYRLSMYRKIKSKYAKDIYEKLSVWLRNYRQHKYNLDELHTMLNTPKYVRDSYKRFRENILDPAVAEINEKTDWTIEYAVEKKRLYDKKTGKRRMKTSDIIFIRTDEDAPSGFEMSDSADVIDVPDPKQVTMFTEEKNDVEND